MGLGNKKDKKCYTCRYWTGCVRVKSPQFVEYPDGQNAKCNLTGHNRPAWTSCKNYEKRLDF